MSISGFRGTNGITFSVTSDVKEPNYVSQKINEFIELYLKKIEEMTEKTFEEIKKALEINKTQKPLHLQEESSELFYYQIMTHKYNFDMIENYKKDLAKIKKEDVITVYKKVLMAD